MKETNPDAVSAAFQADAPSTEHRPRSQSSRNLHHPQRYESEGGGTPPSLEGDECSQNQTESSNRPEGQGTPNDPDMTRERAGSLRHYTNDEKVCHTRKAFHVSCACT